MTTQDMQEQLTPEEGPVIRPFADTLHAVQNGGLATEAAEKLHDLLLAIEETGKGGSLTLTLAIAPLNKGDANVLTVAGTVAVKAPKSAPPASVVYLNKGNIQRDNPQAAALPGLRRVDLDESPVRKVEQS